MTKHHQQLLERARLHMANAERALFTAGDKLAESRKLLDQFDRLPLLALWRRGRLLVQHREVLKQVTASLNTARACQRLANEVIDQALGRIA